MPADAAEVERLRTVVAHVHQNLLTLIDARPKQPGFIPGAALPALYESTFNAPLNPEALTGQLDLKAMLNRRNIFPSIGVRGSEKKGGWLIYRVAAAAARKSAAEAGVGINSACPPELVRVQDNILAVLHRTANPTDPAAKPHASLDAGTLLNRYGEQCRQRFNFRDFGFPTLRALLEACPKLAVVMKASTDKARGDGKSVHKDKMHVAIRRDPTLQTGKRLRGDEAAPPAGSAAAPAPAPAADEEREGEDDAAAAKLARKAAKRAKRAAEAGLSEAEADAAREEAKARRKEKKAAGKEKKKAFLAGQRC